MKNTEIHQAIANRDPLFFWIRLSSGEQFLAPFVCQRCGNCCQVVFEIPCRHLKEPDLCSIYESRPDVCRGFPLYTKTLAWAIDCPGYLLIQKAVNILSKGLGYTLDYDNNLTFQTSNRLNEVIANLENNDMPEQYINKFEEINN